jgi:hypothetical protein
MADKGKQPIKEDNTPPKKRTIREGVFFQIRFFLSFAISYLPPLVFSSLDLLPKEIFGTEEVPEYISSDSSPEEEDATPEQRSTTSCAAAFDIWSTIYETPPPTEMPNANAA